MWHVVFILYIFHEFYTPVEYFYELRHAKGYLKVLFIVMPKKGWERGYIHKKVGVLSKELERCAQPTRPIYLVSFPWILDTSDMLYLYSLYYLYCRHQQGEEPDVSQTGVWDFQEPVHKNACHCPK